MKVTICGYGTDLPVFPVLYLPGGTNDVCSRFRNNEQLSFNKEADHFLKNLLGCGIVWT